MKIITFSIFAFFILFYVGCLSAKQATAHAFRNSLTLGFEEDQSLTNFSHTINVIDEEKLERIYTIDLLLFDQNENATKIIVFAPPLPIIKK